MCLSLHLQLWLLTCVLWVSLMGLRLKEKSKGSEKEPEGLSCQGGGVCFTVNDITDPIYLLATCFCNLPGHEPFGKCG